MLVSLNAHDRHALDLIEEELAGSDPQFAARMSAFSRLADGGTMPERERIRTGRRCAFRPNGCGHCPGSRGTSRWLTLAAVAVWLAVSGGLLAVALVASHIGAGAPCAQWQAAVCTSRVAPHSHPVQRAHSPARAP